MEKHNISLKVEDLSQETKTCMMGGIGLYDGRYDGRYRPSPNTSGPPIYATSHKAKFSTKMHPTKVITKYLITL